MASATRSQPRRLAISGVPSGPHSVHVVLPDAVVDADLARLLDGAGDQPLLLLGELEVDLHQPITRLAASTTFSVVMPKCS